MKLKEISSTNLKHKRMTFNDIYFNFIKITYIIKIITLPFYVAFYKIFLI